MNKRSIMTVEQLCDAHPAFTPASVRWWLFRREENGLNRAVIRLGRKLLIDESAFFDWLDDHREAAGPQPNDLARRLAAAH